MLEKYRDKYPKFCDDLDLIISEKKVFHAYLIDVGNTEDYINIIKTMAIKLLNDNTNIDVEKLIDNDSYSDFFIVSPKDSRWIKKEQILSLQEKYKTKSIYNNKRVYVIDMADNLNLTSSNTLLKFLEEPSEDIVAILLTRNIYGIIPTILSRCQILKLDTVLDEKKEIRKNVIDFFKKIDEKKASIIPYLKSINIDFDNRNELRNFVEEIIRYYEDLCKIILKKKVLYYNEYENVLMDLLGGQKINTISNKILEINEIFSSIDFNVNTRLFIDKLVMIIVGVDVDV